MTTRFGSLVGTPKQASRPIMIPSYLENGTDHVLVRDTIELAAAPANDLIELAVLPWETVLNPAGCRIWFDDLGTSNTVSIGDVTYPTALASAVDTSTAASGADGVSAMKAVDIASYFLPLWQQLGYASLAAAKLIGAQCQLLAKINTAADTGTLTWQLVGQARYT